MNTVSLSLSLSLTLSRGSEYIEEEAGITIWDMPSFSGLLEDGTLSEQVFLQTEHFKNII